MATKIEHFPVIDFITEEIGEKIESYQPLLEVLKDTNIDSPEYMLLNKIWIDWCTYLEG